MFCHRLNRLWFGLVWLVECWCGGIFEVFELEQLLDFARSPVASTPLSWEFFSTSGL